MATKKQMISDIVGASGLEAYAGLFDSYFKDKGRLDALTEMWELREHFALLKGRGCGEQWTPNGSESAWAFNYPEDHQYPRGMVKWAAHQNWDGLKVVDACSGTGVPTVIVSKLGGQVTPVDDRPHMRLATLTATVINGVKPSQHVDLKDADVVLFTECFFNTLPPARALKFVAEEECKNRTVVVASKTIYEGTNEHVKWPTERMQLLLEYRPIDGRSSYVFRLLP